MQFPVGMLQMGQYNRNFAKSRLSKMDAQFGKDGQSLDLVKARGVYADGKRLQVLSKHIVGSRRLQLLHGQDVKPDSDALES